MTIKQFYKKAEEGGWKHNLKSVYPAEILLDPKAWEAVGKVKGWDAVCYICKAKEGVDSHKSICSKAGWSDESDENTPRWWIKQMVNDLFEGKSIEEFIETL